MSLDTLEEWTYSDFDGLVDESRGVFFYFDQDLYVGDIGAYERYVFFEHVCGDNLKSRMLPLLNTIREYMSDSSFESASCDGSTCTFVESGEYGDTVTLTFDQGSDQRPVLIDVSFIGNRYPARTEPILTDRSCQ